MVVYKYKLDKTFIRQTIEMPSCAEIISAVVVDDTPYVYAMINDDMHGLIANRTFQIISTGAHIPDSEMFGYIATIQVHLEVYHVFEFYSD